MASAECDRRSVENKECVVIVEVRMLHSLTLAEVLPRSTRSLTNVVGQQSVPAIEGQPPTKPHDRPVYSSLVVCRGY